MSNFTLDLSKFGEKAVKNAEKIVRKIALDMHRGICEEMPVDTGRAKANTSVIVGDSFPAEPVNVADLTPRGTVSQATIAKAESGVSGFKLGDVIHVFNNVEYIVPLEYGSSRQSPHGMFRVTFNRIVDHLKAGGA